ncbi:MAG: hypothetical protein M1819_003569 [Sarea resinae]|nr:MAG: hypothetical protein M1819_003569 [Sarea resinae]
MADLEAELLALAGGDTSSDEDVPRQVSKSARSPTPASLSDGPAGQAGSKSRARSSSARKSSQPAGGRRRAAKKADRGDSEEEGEASSAPSEANSLQSASMSESDSDASPELGITASLYPIEGRFKSEQDKVEIMKLSEIERETILTERANEMEEAHQNEILRRRRLGRSDGAGAEGGRKRKATSTKLDDRKRKSSRQKTTLGGRKVGESSKPLEEYKRQREQRGINNEQRKRDEDGDKRQRVEDGFSDADAEGESENEVEWDKGDKVRRRSTSTAPNEQPAELIDFERVKVGRSNLAQVCFYPGFEKAITGCFARVSIGMDDKKEMVYRMVQIKGFTSGKHYALEKGDGKRFVTDQYALCAFGKAEKNFPFIVCSNSRFSEKEFTFYKNTLEKESLPIPTKPFLIKKIADIDDLLDHTWTDQEIQEKLRRSGALQSKLAIFERNEIIDRRKEAVRLGDEAAVAKCDAELAALEGPKLAYGTSLVDVQSKVPKPPNQQERLAALNRANRKANAEDIRRAQIAEKRADARAQAAVARGEATANPFQRVKTRARIHYDVNSSTHTPPTNRGVDDLFGEDSDKSRVGTPLNTSGANTPGKSATPIPTGTPSLLAKAKGEKKSGLPTIRQRNMDDDIIGSMDLGIEIDI